MKMRFGGRTCLALAATLVLALIDGSSVTATPHGSVVGGFVDNDVRSVPSSARFDLTAPSADFFRSKSLHDVTVQQGFAFDQKNGRLFVVQRKNGASDTSGDLAITQLSFSGSELGYMYLTGFGHGVSIAAEGVGSDTYLWTETDVGSSGYGQKLARFKFTSGKTLSNTSSALTKFKPKSSAGAITPTIDPLGPNLVVRYAESGAQHIAAWSLAAATRGDFSAPLYDFTQPSFNSKSDTLQGYAVYGRYLYIMTGTSYDANGNVVNSEVTAIDVNSASVVQGPTLTKAGESLTFREPEGLAIYTASGEPRLFLGFASGSAGDRRSNLFYKNKLV